MLTLDRYMDFHFFTNDLGGNQMMYVNLIWAWGHPEVYILILPCFGIFSEVVATFSKSVCSATPRWCGLLSQSLSCPLSFGYTTSLLWGQEPT